ncbi:MAG: aminoglycoside phosphotransferase family protein [Pseudomonadales bacterium]
MSNDNARAWSETLLQDAAVSTPLTWSSLPVEASHRRFHRAHFAASVLPGIGSVTSVILMTSPPALEQNAQFLHLADIFRRAGLGVPAVLAVDAAAGWFLLEDLGARHFADVYGTDAENAALSAALESLLLLQRVQDPSIGAYTGERFATELGLFTEWFAGRGLDVALPAAVTDAVYPILIENALEQPQCCIHRDWHCRNLLYRHNQPVGIVDFQDALIGPACYDLASLLADCYHRFDARRVEHWLAAWLARCGFDLDPDRLTRLFDLTAIQRQLKAVGIFARLELRDGKSSHLRWIAPVLGELIARSAPYPELTPLHDSLRRLAPLAARRFEWADI